MLKAFQFLYKDFWQKFQIIAVSFLEMTDKDFQ